MAETQREQRGTGELSEGYDETIVECGREEYLILTEDEREKKIEETIADSLWAFNADYLASYMPEGMDADTIRMIQEVKCEDCNDAFKRLLRWSDTKARAEFINDATSCDGVGHFLSSYDGNEYEWFLQTKRHSNRFNAFGQEIADGIEFYIYRIN